MPSSSPTGLDRDFIERQRRRLQALRRQLLGGEQAQLARERAFRQLHGDEALEDEEQAQGMAEREVEQALHDVDDRRVADVERALQKIAEGSYGLSDRSGAPIDRARLESTPEAILTMEEERSREAGT